MLARPPFKVDGGGIRERGGGSSISIRIRQRPLTMAKDQHRVP